jgi:phosphoribosylformylglycinamidine (FGAM) synthase PurS component
MKSIIVLLVTGVAVAVAAHPGFDPKDVVGRVRRAQASSPAQGFDAGEFLIDTSISTHVPAPNDQKSPAIAFDGGDFLVVWEDCRNETSDIYAARVTPQGIVLDPLGIAVSTAANTQGSAAVSFDGDNFLVVWTDERSGSYSDIYAARVTPQGVVLDPSGIAVSTAAYEQCLPTVAFDGANFLVAWEDYRGGVADIYAARMSPQGTVLDPQGIAISTATSWQFSPAVAFDGTDFLVAWEDNRSDPDGDIYATRVTSQGVVLDPSGIAVSTAANEQYLPAIAFDGANCLVAWDDARLSPDQRDIYAARVTSQGVVLDPSGIAVSTDTCYQSSPAIGFDGANFLVAWRDTRNGSDCDIYAARVTPQGTVLDPQGIVTSTEVRDQQFPAVGFGAADFLVVWEDRRSGVADVYAARVTPQGSVRDLSGIVVSTAASWQLTPAIAFDGANYLVVWQDGGGSPLHEYDIYAARVTPQGVMIDSAGIAVSTAGDDQSAPSVAFDGTNFLVVWEDGRHDTSDIYAARVTPQGEVLDPLGIAVSTAVYGQCHPAIAFDGANFLVTWDDERRAPSDIFAARVTPQGTVLDPTGIAVSTAAQTQESPAVAFDGDNFLVVWEDYRSHSTYNIYAARVTSSGAVLDTGGIAVSTAGGNQGSPAVAFDGVNFLAAWNDGRNDQQIYAARVTPQGTVLDPSGIAISNVADCWSPAVAFDGTNSLVVWMVWGSDSAYDIYGARVTPAGAVLDSGPVVRQEGNQWFPALARGNGGQLFLGYAGWTGAVGGKTCNADRIWGELDPVPGVEERGRPDVSRPTPAATIVRGVLFLPTATGHGPRASSILLDITGRNVKELRPGPNDVSRLAPGVYFVRQAQAQAQAQSVRKVVIQ